jgi:serine/threonine protein kinase
MADLDRVREVFEQVSGLAPEQRAARLAEIDAAEPEVAAMVRRMLEQSVEVTEAGGFEASEDTLPAATVVGHYTIRSVLGRGGMGAVYLAEQDKPRRTVALKLIRAGVASDALRRRFELEAEVLGRLRHPSIAQVYEAGIADTPSGKQPYFAMELVEGEPLDDYAYKNGLGTRARLELMSKIADAVHHAHQQGVIHRDLKPGNILVTADGQPKVLDFGVARATDADIQTTTLQTDIGQLIGTVPYMSPEQAAGDPKDLDTRSDVYALGVVTYELLVGRLPYELKDRMVHEAVRIIREEEPTRLSTIDRALRGDVDTIVGTALMKEKERRYQSAAELGADIRRYLADEPISARPPSATYQLRKFARRNKTLVTGVAATFLVLVAGIIATSLALVRAIDAEELASERADQAETALERAETAFDFVDNTVLGQLDPARGGSRSMTALDLISRSEAEIEDRLEGDPYLERRIRHVIGRSFARLGLRDRALAHLDRAHRLAEDLHGEMSLEYAEAERALAWTDFWAGYHSEQLSEAAGRISNAARITQELLGEDDPLTQRDLGDVAVFQAMNEGRVAAGLDPATLKMVALIRGRGETNEEIRDVILQVVGAVDQAWRAGQHERAQELIHEFVEPVRTSTMFRQRLPLGLTGYGKILLEEDQFPHAAEALATYAVEWGQEHLPALDTGTLAAENFLAEIFISTGRLDEAIAIGERLLPGIATKYGRDSIFSVYGALTFTSALAKSGQFERAERELLASWDAFSARQGNVTTRGFLLRNIVEFYKMWHKAEPDMGYDAKAAEWQTRVDNIDL